MLIALVLIAIGVLALFAGITSQGIGQLIREGLGKGFLLADIAVPKLNIDELTFDESTGGGRLGPVSKNGLNSQGGAKAIVDSAAAIAQSVSSNLFVVSAHRPGDPKDHGSNDADKAARDIAKRGVDALVGPPSRELDEAVIAIGAAFGRKYRAGQTIVDTFNWEGFRIQIIWRTPAYGGHMGHIHIGARKL